MTKYIVKSNNYKFLVEIKKNEYFDRIIFGCPRKCIYIDYYKDENTGHIQGLSYYKNCNIAKEMLRSSILFFYNIYEKTDYITLKDISTIKCSSIKISLPLYDFIEYGKTWYERNFNAKIDEKKYRIILNNIWKMLNLKIVESINMSFEEFNERFILINDRKYNIKNSSISYINSIKISEKIKKYYDINKSLYDFFHQIRQNEKCEIFYLWLETFFAYIWKKVCKMLDLKYLENINISNLEWKIKKNDIKNYDPIKIFQQK